MNKNLIFTVLKEIMGKMGVEESAYFFAVVASPLLLNFLVI